MMKKIPAGKLFLVGAGPGDPGLISVRGLKLVETACVILYDALVSPQLLAHARAGCRLVFVGKRKGKKEFSQEEINELLVFYARRFSTVVRLKGGDPFVFGRGHEEAAFALLHQIEVEIIPGITSAIAAPAACGIPVTTRGLNESFWVVTGMLSSGEMSGDIALAAQSTATVVILMGMTHLREIATVFEEARSSDEPVAVIQHATTPAHRVVTGTVRNIRERVISQDIGAPAVIVIGRVVDARLALAAIPQTSDTQVQN